MYKKKRMLAALLVVSMIFGMTGCDKEKKEPKPTPKATAAVDEGNANASGKGDGQADVPLIIGCKSFAKNFNPFSAENEADRQAVDLTQIKLVTNDRAGKILYKGIDGEVREYDGKSYTYYGATDLEIDYREKTDTTKYTITLRDDLVFSNGEKLTIDDVIFSMYVFCDTSYKGSMQLKNMPIKGLLNYQADSRNAEKLSDKKVQRYIKKNSSKLKKWIAVNITKKGITGNRAKSLIENQARIFLAKNKGKKVKNISGIKKVNDYQMTVITRGYERKFTSALQIPVCALHYYGNVDRFDVGKNQFGFTRGDISSILANRIAPLGAGAYRFVKLEDNVAYFASNELYYLGCPQIAYLHLKDMTDILSEKKELQASEKKGKEAQEESESGEEVLPVEAKELKEGVVDVIAGSFTQEEIQQIMSLNSNGKLSGNTVAMKALSDGEYHYIGIHAGNVAVGKNAGSVASKNLRKAFATLFAAARGSLKETEGEQVSIVNYPVAAESWVSLTEQDEEYAVAYSKDIRGTEIFEDDGTTEVKMELVQKIALEYLENAGYETEDGRVIKAPAGASLHYKFWIADGEENRLYPLVEKVRQSFEKIGITLNVIDMSRETLEEKLLNGTQQLWAGSRAIQDMDMNGRYDSTGKNLFGVKDKKLEKVITRLQGKLNGEERVQTYQKSFSLIMEQAVEVPVCEFRYFTLFSAKRIDGKTIPENCTPYYSWTNEIQKIVMQ